MRNIIEVIKSMINEASEMHQRERQLTLESVRVCGRLYQFRAHVTAGLTMDEFALRIGLTPDVYAKRAKAYQLMTRFPRVRAMVESGEMAITSVAALHGKITDANQARLLEAVANKSKREVERVAARITPGGDWIEGEAEVELKIVVKESDMAKIQRAREVLSHGGKVPVTVEVLMKAIEDLLERRDPVRKAGRAVARDEKSESRWGVRGQRGEDGKDRVAVRPGAARSSIPARVRHQVILRDQARCTWVNPDGTRCPERMMIELDHIIPWRNGGQHTVSNLTCRCRHHNAYRAEMELGRPLLERG